jgi:serine/threonine protein phosphatase PrpC
VPADVEESVAEVDNPASEADSSEDGLLQAELVPEPIAEAPPVITCHVCGWVRQNEVNSCPDCGYHFTPADLAEGPAMARSSAMPSERILGRYQIVRPLGERGGVARFQALDHGGSGGAVPVVLVRQLQTLPALEIPMAEAIPLEGEPTDDEILPGFDLVLPANAPVTEVLPNRPLWPSLTWEHDLISSLDLPALPTVLDQFAEGGFDYLVEEIPPGRSLWEAWDDPAATASSRYGWLAQIAETLFRIHQTQHLLECLRPDLIVVSDSGQARLTDLGDLLPLPLPENVPLRGTLYTAPELVSGQSQVDARAALYSFGALLYALHVGRELSETDFDRPGHPKPFIPRFPDIHPAFGRLLTKTFRREVDSRFPSDEAAREDATGFTELIRTLRVFQRTLDNVRMEIASWTTTGIVRTGNEDAFALLHSVESRQDDLGESAMILLCDGMGGYEAGEVAAALTIQALRKNLLAQPVFAALAGQSPFPTDPLASTVRPEGHAGPPLDVEACKQLLKAALKDANKQVFTASRAPGNKRRGMGCTAEAVYLDGRNVVVGHVGDSRTYHYHEGQLIQLTRDQTLVNRLVELGTLTPEEAETHPRRNELQQAIGGQPDVEPGLYSGKLTPGDWVVVCSDGVTNHVTFSLLKEMLQSEASSAEMAARRLVNLTNIEGATDNATVVVVRIT